MKMKPTDLNTSTYIEYSVENNGKGPNFKVGNHVITLKYKKKFFLLSKLEILYRRYKLLIILTV